MLKNEVVKKIKEQRKKVNYVAPSVDASHISLWSES